MAFPREMGQHCSWEVSTRKHTNPPTPVTSLWWRQKRKGGERVRKGQGSRRQRESLQDSPRTSHARPSPPQVRPHPLPPLAAAVPAVGAGLAALRGGDVLLPVLGGRGRASPFANLGREGETKTRLELTRSPSCVALVEQKAPRPSCLQDHPKPVSWELKLSGKGSPAGQHAVRGSH